ncbi:MAG: hypothetical protein B6I20_01230 [Bacteroidetes bacterium 4572_117]|nr:MAG: hypothetical protein B6I20_01230 [Bacteroidetes bacterium 4572_117]
MEDITDNTMQLANLSNKWQVTADLLVKFLETTVALIMRVHKGKIEVFVASKSDSKLYKLNEKLSNFKDSYCNMVLKKNAILNIPNALKDENWKNNPAVKFNLISYLGMPIFYSDKTPFGIICVLDNKERHFTNEHFELLQQFKDLIEADLMICQHSIKKEEKINQQLIEERNIFTKGNVVVFKWVIGGKWPVEYVSQNVANVFGYSVEDFISKKINYLDIIHKEDLQRVANEVKAAQQKNTSNFEHKEYRIVHKNGNIVWLYDYTTVLKNNKGEITHYLGYVRDITTSKLLEIEKEQLFKAVTKQRDEFELLNQEYIVLNEKLESRNLEIKASEEKFRLLFENSPLGIFTTLPNGQIVDANQALINILDSPSIDDTKKINILSFSLLIENGFADDFKQAHKTGENISKEYLYKSKWGKSTNMWGHIVPLKNADGKINKMYVIVEDISKRKKVETELKNQKKLFETVFDSISDAIMITDTSRKIKVSNKGAFNLFNYSFDEIIGTKADIIYADKKDFDDAGKKIFDKTAQKRKGLYVTQYKNKSGQIFSGETFGTKLHDENGEWIGNLGVIRDVSERLKMIEELHHAKEKAEESDQLKTAFLNNLSHEIRTPMNSIIGFSQLLKDVQLSQNKRNLFVDRVMNSSNQLLSIVDDIITISKIESNQEVLFNSTISAINLLSELFNHYQLKANKKNIKLEYIQKLNKGEDIIYADREKLNQILNNLISNALKFTHKGTVKFGCKVIGDFIEFFVKDTGIGIDDSMNNEIFERFRQVEILATREYGGLGLGLAISKGYIELMGGKIRLVSELNKGSEFYFTLPYKPLGV